MGGVNTENIHNSILRHVDGSPVNITINEGESTWERDRKTGLRREFEPTTNITPVIDENTQIEQGGIIRIHDKQFKIKKPLSQTYKRRWPHDVFVEEVGDHQQLT